MNVLITTGIFPPDVGGPATYVPRLAAALVARGHEVRVLTLSDRIDHDDAGYDFEVYRIRRGGRRALRALRTIHRIRRLARHADVVLANGLPVEVGLALRPTDTPLVAKVVGDQAWERMHGAGRTDVSLESFQAPLRSPEAMLRKWVRTRAVRAADRVITPSRYMARLVAGWGVDPDRIEVVHNAVDTRPVEPAPLPEHAGITLVTAGRLIPLKAVDAVVRAVGRLEDARLYVLGDGTERPRLERLARDIGAADRVVFTGFVSRDETLRHARAADIVVLNSVHETFPHFLLEAMAQGTPVIATAAGGTPEIVIDGETGVLIPVSDDQALQHAIARLAADAVERRRLGEAGQRHVRERFAMERMVDETESLLNRAAAGRARNERRSAIGDPRSA